MALIVSTSITLGETSAQQKTNPKELLFPGELFTGPCWGALWSVSHVKEQQSPVPTLPVSPGPHGTDPVLQPRHPKEPLPVHPSTSLGQKQIPSHLKGVCIASLGKEPTSATSPCPGPSSSSSLSQAWLGMENAAGTEAAPLSLHLVTSLGFGLKSFQRTLPHPLAEPSSLRPWRSHQPPTLLCPAGPVHTFQEKHKQQLPDTSASQIGPTFTVASDRIKFIAVQPPQRAEKSSVRKQIPKWVQPPPSLCPLSHQPRGR